MKRRVSEREFVLRIKRLDVIAGERIALTGESGCGKSTALDILAMVLRPDEIEQFIFDPQGATLLDVAASWHQGDLDRLAATRMHHIGYVLQTGGLLPFFNAKQNAEIVRKSRRLHDSCFMERLMKKLDISHLMTAYPAQLSVGERQRVAIARALAGEPSVVLADEPTASLDPINAEEVMNLFCSLAKELGITLIVATHDWQRIGHDGFRQVRVSLTMQQEGHTVEAEIEG